MNNEEFEKSIKELEQSKKQNDYLIEINDERTRMAKVNGLEFKVANTLAFSAVGYVLLLIITVILVGTLGVSAITNIFPGFTYPIVLIGGALGIGKIIMTLFEKNFQIKERLKNFSTSKTQTEKLEEEIYYQIELEKAINRNVVIDEAIKVLNSNQETLSRISNKYDLNDKTMPQTKEEAYEKAKELSTIIKEQYDKLDILTTQKVLKDRFWRIREKFQRKLEPMIVSMMSGAFTMIFTILPTIMMNDVVPGSSLLGIFALPIASFVTGGIIGGTYMLKRNKNYMKVFNNLNEKLGENAVERTISKRYDTPYEEQKEIERLIENQIGNISLSEARLQENKRYLDTFTTEEEKKEDVLFKDFPQLHITEETKKDVLENYERYSGCDARIRMGKFYTDEERKKYIEESLERTLPGEEKGPTLTKKYKPRSK